MGPLDATSVRAERLMPPAKARSRRGQPRLRNGREFFVSLSSEETGWKMDVAVGEEEAAVAKRDVFLDVVGLFTGVVSTLRKPSAVLEIEGVMGGMTPVTLSLCLFELGLEMLLEGGLGKF